MAETPVFNSITKNPPSLHETAKMPRQEGAPIATALDQQAAEVANLIDEVDLLIEKIRPVTGPERPEPTASDLKEQEVAVSDVANLINKSTEKLAILRRYVHSIRERVEL